MKPNDVDPIRCHNRIFWIINIYLQNILSAFHLAIECVFSLYLQIYFKDSHLWRVCAAHSLTLFHLHIHWAGNCKFAPYDRMFQLCLNGRVVNTSEFALRKNLLDLTFPQKKTYLSSELVNFSFLAPFYGFCLLPRDNIGRFDKITKTK